MVELYFVPAKVRRSTTRGEWQSIWREARVMRKQIAQSNQDKVNLIQTLSDTKLKQMLMDEMIYPPLVLGPGME